MTSIKRMSGLEINVVVNEIKQQLLGLRVVNVYSINKRTYLIKLSGTNEYFPVATKQYLLIESGVRLHLTNFEREIDSTPNGLATTMRSSLKGKTLANIEQNGLDRVVKLGFGIGQTSFNIFVELFGTGNIVFTDYEHNILALLKQQAYGSSLLGSKNPEESGPITTPSTTTSLTNNSTNDMGNNTVTLRSKYQWNEQISNQTFPPAQISLDFVLALFRNKHQRLLEQLQNSQDENINLPNQNNRNKKERKKDNSQKVTVKQVLYESILGPQLCLHGCTQFSDLDINQLYTTVLTDVDYLTKLVKALQVGLDYYFTIIKDCSGYLYTRLTTTLVENFDPNGVLLNTKTDEVLVTGDFSPGNLSQTTISPTIYIAPVTSISGSNTTAATNSDDNNNNDNNNNNNKKDANTAKSTDGQFEVLKIVGGSVNKINANEATQLDKNGNVIKTSLYQTFELPENGYQTFNWGLIKPTSTTVNTINTVKEKDDKNAKKNKWNLNKGNDDATKLQDVNTPQPTTRTTIIIKDVWFYTARFSACVDIYYGTKEVEKEVQRIEREKTNVLTRIEKTKIEQMSKLQTLQDNIETMLLKAKLIESNETFIQQAIDVVRQQLDRGRDWFVIADIIKQAQNEFHPLALLIDKLEFHSNSFIALLSWDLEHIHVKIQKELVRRNKEKAKLHQEHIIGPVDSDDDSDNDDRDNNNDNQNDNDDDSDSDSDNNDGDQDTTYIDDVNDEAIQIAKDDQAEELARSNAPGSWRKPVKITINYNQTAFANAKMYYTMVKELVRKKQVAAQFSEQTIKSIEKKGQKELHQVKEIQAKQRRKIMWFEKFFWCVSSENFLIVGGRDATQNEILVKRYLDTNDIYFHADIHGASSVVVKVPTSYVQSYQAQFGTDKPLQLPQITLYEAAAFTTCHSNAWVNKTNNIRAYWVYSHQVSKTPPTGMYLEKGSFMIRGNKNYIEPQALQMGVALLFKCGDDETILNHQNERQVRSLGSLQQVSDGKDTNSIFQSEQNRKQHLQELHILRLEEEERDKKQQKLELERLKLQKSQSLGSPTLSNVAKVQTKAQFKRILSKADRYQMKKLGMVDPAVYWAHKDAQTRANGGNDVDPDAIIIPDCERDDGDDSGNDDDDDDDNDDEVNFDVSDDEFDGVGEVGEDENEDGDVPHWLRHAKEKFGISDSDVEGKLDGDDEDDEGDSEDEIDLDEDVEIGDDVDENGDSPEWLKRSQALQKNSNHGGDRDDDDDDKEEDEDDEDDDAEFEGEFGEDHDENGEVPEWLGKAVGKSTTKPKELLEKNKIYQGNLAKNKKGKKGSTNLAGPEPERVQPKSEQPGNKPRGGKNTKAGKRNANKGFDDNDDEDDDDAKYDPMRFLSKAKQKSLLKTSILAVSSEEEELNKNKKPQHGVNRKKGNTKQARLERQQEAQRIAEEAKLAKQKQAEERDRLHKEKLAAKKLAKQKSLGLGQSGENDDDVIIIDDDIGDDDLDDLDDAALQKLQQQRLEMEGTNYILSTLTSKPQLGDYITHVIPVVAPYQALLDYPFKVKLVPGGGKKGLTIKDSVHVLLQNVNGLYKHPPQTAAQISAKAQNNSATAILPIDQLSPEEQLTIQKEKNFQNLLSSLIKQVSDSEFSLTMISNAKVSVQGIQQVHRQQKIQKKNNAKQKEKQKKSN